MPFHPTPTVYASPCLAGLLHPAASHGVRRVSIFAGETRGLTRRLRSISPTAHALRSFSLASSHPSQDSYPLTVGHPKMVWFQGFTPLVSPWPPARVATRRRSMLPWVSPCRLRFISFFDRGLGSDLTVGYSRGCLAKLFLLTTSLAPPTYAEARRKWAFDKPPHVPWVSGDTFFRGLRSRRLRPRTGPKGPWVKRLRGHSTLLLPFGSGCSVSVSGTLQVGRAVVSSRERTPSRGSAGRHETCSAAIRVYPP